MAPEKSDVWGVNDLVRCVERKSRSSSFSIIGSVARSTCACAPLRFLARNPNFIGVAPNGVQTGNTAGKLELEVVNNQFAKQSQLKSISTSGKLHKPASVARSSGALR